MGSAAAAMPTDVLRALPDNLPVPQDDGASAHLDGLRLPAISLPATTGARLTLADVPGWLVLFCYPMTGRPGKSIPDGWAAVPGAAGCTPQACSFRDNFGQLAAMGVSVFGLSTQSPDDQAEAASRLHLPFPLLSDQSHAFSSALRLPMLEVAGMRLTKRLTLIAKDGIIQKSFYPVFPPDKNVDAVLAWFAEQGV